MKKIIYGIIFGIIFSFLVCSVTEAKKNNDNSLSTNFPITSDLLLNNSNLGTEFWVAIPKNESINGDLKQVAAELVCTSPFNTQVTMEVPELGIIKTKNLEANKITSFSTKQGDFGWTMEVSESESLTKKGIRLKADKPFSVYVISAKEFSADGYLAFPVSMLGTEYYHSAYYDFFETNRLRGGGFIVVGAEPSTAVTITLNGIGALAAKTAGGRTIGQTINVQMGPGDTYMVCGDGKTKGEFDLSGTKIKASKPVGVISFHMRTMIPSICPEDRDHLSEMLAPVSQWGKKFITIQFDRKQFGERKGKGDLFRMTASQDATAITCDFYDIATFKKEGGRGFSMNRAGEFREGDPIPDIGNSNTKTSIYGIAVWDANKPVQLVQNAFSNRWDGDSKWAPLAVVVPPVEQFVRSCVFSTPEQSGFNEHSLALVVIGDPKDPDLKLLKSVVIDGIELWRKEPKFLLNRIPGTDFYYMRLSLNNLPDPPTSRGHYIISDTKFYGYLTGFSNSGSYGYPVGMGMNKIDEFDEQPPSITKTVNCGNWALEASEIAIGKPTDDPQQKDQGISQIVLIDSVSYNYNIILDNPANFKPHLKMTKQKFNLNLIDNSKQAKAVFAVLDRAGNMKVDSVEYQPVNIQTTPSLDFGTIRIKRISDKLLEIKNSNSINVNLKSLTIKGKKFKINNPPTLPFTLIPDQSLSIGLSYFPDTEADVFPDKDTVMLSFDCNDIKVPLTGKAIMPKIKVQSYDFGTIKKGNQKCLEEINGNGVRIENIGSDTLIVLGFSEIKPPFFISSPTVPQFPFTVLPKQYRHVTSLCFLPVDSVRYSQNFTIKSDAESGDSLITISGNGKIDSIISVEEDYLNNAISITPNPASDEIFIRFNNDRITNVFCEIYDIIGRLLISENITYNKAIKLISLPNGIYSITTRVGYQIYSRKLIISR